MDIQYAILGLLSWQPFSGYDIKKIIAESHLFYWSGNNNQIYNSLIAMHNEGLVSQEVIAQENLPAKKVYTITAEGRQRLQLWLNSDPELPELRNNFLIQLAWADALSPAELDGLLSRYEEEVDVQLRMRQAKAGDLDAHLGRTPRERYLWKMISENITSAYQHELEWVRQVREDLKKGPFSAAEEFTTKRAG